MDIKQHVVKAPNYEGLSDIIKKYAKSNKLSDIAIMSLVISNKFDFNIIILVGTPLIHITLKGNNQGILTVTPSGVTID